jgi:hypothetical protein
MKLVKNPEKTQRCFFTVKESDTGTGHYWEGWCEGDKDSDRFEDNKPLELLPENFIGSSIIEVVPTCPDCGLGVIYRDGGWYCEDCLVVDLHTWEDEGGSSGL